MGGYYDKEGKPITSSEWAKLFQDVEYKVVRQTTTKNNYFISTVWLGLDHGHGLDEILIFETMVFDMKNGFTGRDLFMERYETEEQAKQGHREAVWRFAHTKRR